MKTQISIKLILIGLLSQIDFSQSRAVNISNTWTLPQAGFNVFYRYFRDKISWFEADAVCQFHHANLVTVENIEQFDAARQFLKELDIPDFVWIGLMRPSNTDQFSWTNSKPLPVSEGYWAEPWPVSDAPLCAVIDPSKDYRWHSLRCGGPETAAFLCEMEIPDWALHCTENPDLTVQYISDSGAVQLTRSCNDTIKEISCQSKASKMDLYNALRCSDEEIVIATTTIITTKSTTEEVEAEPKVIIKNPQKMMEDIFDSLNSDVVIDSNRLEETNVEHKVDLDLMMGDQPIASEDEPEDKKILLKQPEKKEFYAKKSKQKSEKLKVKDDEPMMGDAPVEEIVHSTDDIEQSTFIPTTDRQRRDANLLETTMSTTDASSTVESTESSSNVEESSSTELPPSTPTEQQMTTTVTEEATTRLYVQGHPLHMSQAIFKEPIQPDVHGTHERIEIGESEDRFIPPMLLVKAKLTSTTTEVILTSTADTASSTDQTIVDVTDITDENSTLSATTQKPEMSNDIPSNETQATQLENTITTVVASEKPILIEKRNDPRLGLKAATTSTQIIMSSTSEVTTVSEELTSLAAESTFESGITTTEETPVTELSDTSSVAVSDTFKPLEALVTASTSHHDEAEKLILLSTTAVAVEQTVEPSTTIISSPSPIALKQTTLKTPEINKSTTTMRNDIDAYHQTEDVSHEEDESSEHYQNNFSNADNYQPYKPNRHRSIKPEHHHGPGFSIGKILG